MRHRIVRAVAWLGELFSRPVTAASHSRTASRSGGTTSTPPRPSPPPRPLDEVIDGDESRLVRPYLVACEWHARERASRLFAVDGGFSVYAS